MAGKMSDKAVQEPSRVIILTPVYNEESSLPAYEEAVRNVLLDDDRCDFRVIFIDDGSRDSSWDIIQEICTRDSRFEGIRLSRNFGSHIALTAGFDIAKGDAFVVLACDLQDPPETVLEFVELWKQGFQIVWGMRRTRQDGFWRNLTSNIFSAFAKKFVMPKESLFTTGSFFLADRTVIDNYRKLREYNRVTFALIAWTGFRQARVEYDRKQRMAGKSGWNFMHMLKALYDVFIGFSPVPIQIVSAAGGVTFLLALCLSAYLFFNWLVGTPAPGWTSIMLLMSVFFAIQFLLMGILGQYLYRIFLEVVGRPLYFVSDSTVSDTPEKPC